MTKTIALILTVLLIAGAFFGTRFAMRLIVRAAERNERRNKYPRNWTAVQGTIDSSKQDSVTYIGGPDLIEGLTTSFVTLRFSYGVEGVRYFGKQTLTIHKAPGNRHPLEHPIPSVVYYDPAKPQKAVIDPEKMSFRGFLIALGLLLAMCLVLGLASGGVILALIRIWTLAEGQPW